MSVVKAELQQAHFFVHGISVKVQGRDLQALVEDWAFFERQVVTPSKCQIDLKIDRRPCTPEDLPAIRAHRIFPDCVMYRHEGRDYYEYQQAVLIVERQGQSSSARLISDDPDSVHERAYLFLQSEVGALLETKGLHRVHALGLGLSREQASLVLLPSGGGKSTLALEVIKAGAILLSDDSPLVDRRGQVLPYPMRLGFRKTTLLPAEWSNHITNFQRQKFGPKNLVSIRALPPSSRPQPGQRFRTSHLILGARYGRREDPALVSISRFKAIGPLFRDLVVGYGLAQVVELVLRDGIWSVLKMLPRIGSRLLAAVGLLLRARVYRFEMSRDALKNAEFLLEFLTRRPTEKVR